MARAYGVPWRIKARVLSPRSPDRALDVYFSIGDPDDYEGTGYFTGLPFPTPHSFLFTGNGGQEIDDFPEADLSGVTASRVERLVVRMQGGEHLSIAPTLAPRPFRKRFPELGALRFYDSFFPADQVPQVMTAFDGDDKVLARRQRDRGGFFAVDSAPYLSRR